MRKLITALVASLLAGPIMADGHRGTAEEAMDMIIGVVDLYSRDGRDAMLSAISDENGPFRDRDLFVIVWDIEGNLVGHGRNSPAVGTNRWDFTDSAGKYLTREIIEAATAGGGWVQYRFTDPKTGEEKDKTTFAIALDDTLVAGIGIYADQ